MLNPPPCFIDGKIQAQEDLVSHSSPHSELKYKLKQIPGMEMLRPWALKAAPQDCLTESSG